MIFNILTCFVILAALCAATPVCIVILCGVLRLFPNIRRIMDDPDGDSQTTAA